MGFPFIVHHGATMGVSGSCHQLHIDAARSVLIDCGLQQEGKSPSALALGFQVEGVQALIVTHVHMDHVGRIPALLAAGFRGPILCSEPSAKLLPLVLEDAFRLGFTREPGQVRQYLALVEKLINPLPFGRWHDLLRDDRLTCRIRLQRAGHVLGSAYVECDVQAQMDARSTRVVFSGDLGAGHNPLLCSPLPPQRADVLVLESTYGDRLHMSVATRQQRLERVIERALEDRGSILIPAFSVGRTQELLYEIEDILHRKSLLQASVPVKGGVTAFTDWPTLPVILDSPLASRLTGAYRQLSAFWNESARQRLREGRAPLGFRQLIGVQSAAQHQMIVNHLASTGRPAIVIAGNGMCSGGRIVNYLKAMLADPRHEVVFTGYQAKGTPGAVIQASEGAEGFVMIDLDSKMYEIKAKVTTLAGYSAHADQAGLAAFADAAEKVILVHGESAAKAALALVLKARAAAAGRSLVVEVPE
ncbi:MAG: MBL fold metallo-hydrolase [Pseudomonas sp.]